MTSTISPTPVPLPSRPKRVGLWKFVLIQLLAVAALLIVGEYVLKWTGIEPLHSMDPEANPFDEPYPTHPDAYLKIAVFGGSAAQGAFSPRAFDEVLQWELSQRYPEQPVFVRNYAMHGYPFHRHQAEYAKLLIDKYDVILIYCGNNEAENWYDDSGYWRLPEFKEARDLSFIPPPDINPSIIAATGAWLGRHSRIYAFVTRSKESVLDSVYKNRNRDYAEFETAPSLPATERAALVTHFEQDLRDIHALAVAQNKQILLGITAAWESWPPSYSTFRDDLPEDQKRTWMAHYAEGMRQMELGNHDEAIGAFMEAMALDRDVAILNFRIGQCKQRLGKIDEARSFFRQMIDHEGHYFRSITPLHDKARELANELDRIEYVDVQAAFHAVMDTEQISDDELFVDVYHASFLGNVVMAHAFLDKLTSLEPLKSISSQRNSEPPKTWRALAEQRYSELDVQPSEEAAAIAENVLWYFDMAHFCAYPDLCYQQIARLLERMEHVCGDEPMFRSFAAVTRGRLAILNDQVDLAVTELNAGLQYSARHVARILEMKAWNHHLVDELTRAGIALDATSQRYVRKPVAAE